MKKEEQIYDREKAVLYMNTMREIVYGNNLSVEGLSGEEYRFLLEASTYYKGCLIQEINIIEPFCEAFKKAVERYGHVDNLDSKCFQNDSRQN